MNFLMTGMKVSGELSGQMELKLEELQINPPLSDDLFSFTPTKWCRSDIN